MSVCQALFVTVQPGKTSIKVSSSLETSSIELTVFAGPPLIVVLASYVTKSSLNNSKDLLGPSTTVMERQLPSLLVATSQKIVPLRENRSVPSSSASLESLDSNTLIPVTLNCSQSCN